MSSLELQSVYRRVQTISWVTEMLFDQLRDYPFSLYRLFFVLNDIPSLMELIENESKGIKGFLENFTCHVKKVDRTWGDLIDAMNGANTILVLCKEDCLVKQTLRIAISYHISSLVEEITIAVAEMKTTRTRIEEWHNNILAMEQFSPVFDEWTIRFGQYMEDCEEYYKDCSLFESILNEHYNFFYGFGAEPEEVENLVNKRELTCLFQSSSIQSSTLEDFFRAKTSMAEKRDLLALISLPAGGWYKSEPFYTAGRSEWLNIMNRMESMKVKIRQIMEKMYTNEKNENEEKAVEIL
jgi:hypothetical protein